MAHYLSASAVSAKHLAEEKEKIKTLIGDISHQTKTPIANLLLYAQLLEEQDLPPESRDCAAALERQAEKLRFLIDALVKTSRLETGVLAMTAKRSIPSGGCWKVRRPRPPPRRRPRASPSLWNPRT